MPTSDTRLDELAPATLERMQDAIIHAGEHLRREAARIAALAGTDAADENPHTNLDIEVDEILQDSLNLAFPAGALWVSEERLPPPGRADARFCFIVDPIDGTRNVLHGRPEACVSVALYEKGPGVVWGCIYNPFSGEIFTAQSGRGAFRNGQRIHVSANGDPGNALYLVSIHESVKGMLDRVKSEILVRPVGSIAYKMCLVACGEGDATFTINPRHDWDIAAGMLLVEEAGGEVSDSRGGSILINSRTLKVDGVVVTNGLIHANTVSVCRTLREQIAADSNPLV
ncbi:MAG TPA: inositol monophosphatase family protein [Myxococcota bacterium]|nr:inositol monophosphatase family protein [Myxococcota bacterium]